MTIKHRVQIFSSSILMRLIFLFLTEVSFTPSTFILKYYKEYF